MADPQYLGVRQQLSGRFRASIMNGARGYESLGTFDTAEEEARAFDVRAVQLGGAHCKLNFPHEHAAGGGSSSQQRARTTASGNPKSMYTGVSWNSRRGAVADRGGEGLLAGLRQYMQATLAARWLPPAPTTPRSWSLACRTRRA
jgi:hypothetical protein